MGKETKVLTAKPFPSKAAELMNSSTHLLLTIVELNECQKTSKLNLNAEDTCGTKRDLHSAV